jgi:hypothetical protein
MKYFFQMNKNKTGCDQFQGLQREVKFAGKFISYGKEQKRKRLKGKTRLVESSSKIAAGCL